MCNSHGPCGGHHHHGKPAAQQQFATASEALAPALRQLAGWRLTSPDGLVAWTANIDRCVAYCDRVLAPAGLAGSEYERVFVTSILLSVRDERARSLLDARLAQVRGLPQLVAYVHGGFFDEYAAACAAESLPVPVPPAANASTPA